MRVVYGLECILAHVGFLYVFFLFSVLAIFFDLFVRKWGFTGYTREKFIEGGNSFSWQGGFV